MVERSKLKITVLKGKDSKEIFEEYPVIYMDWFFPCKVCEDGQELIVEENLRMLEGSCQSA